MSFNLLDIVKNHFSTDMVSKVASSLGESEGGISKAISAIIPTVLSGVAGKAASGSGAADIFSMASSALGGGDLATKEIDMIKGLFGGNETKVAEHIAASAGVKASTVSNLMETAAPVAMSAIGGHAKESGLDASGLAGMLSSNLGEWTKMLPEGLGSIAGLAGLGGIASTVSNAISDATSSVSSAAGSVSNAGSAANAAHDRVASVVPTVPEGKGAVRFLLPALLAAAAGFGIWYFMKGKDKVEVEAHSNKNAEINSTETSTEEAVYDPNYKVSGKLEGGEYSYDLGEEKVIVLSNATGGKDTLKVGKYSTEYRLYSFLADNNATLDTAKGNWFDFTNVRFKTGSSDVTETSMAQLENLAKLSNHFKNAKFKIGGYTDNVGAEAVNTALSQKRAEAVSTLLTTKLGIAKDIITGAKGFGPQFPVGDNATPEGKAMNRRVSVNVKAK